MRKIIKRLRFVALSIALTVILLPSYIMLTALTARAAESALTVTADNDSASVTVRISDSQLGNEDVSVICYGPGWNGEALDLKGNKGHILYLNQYRLTDGEAEFTFSVNQKPEKGIYHLAVGSTKGLQTKEFEFSSQPDPSEPGNKSELQNSVKRYEGLKKGDYTPESWTAFEKALIEAKRINSLSNATQAQIDSALSALEKAYAGLKQQPPLPAKPSVPAAGKSHTVGKGIYRVTKSAAVGGTVTYVRPAKKTYTNITIPSTVKINGYSFRVTAIAAKACYRNKKLKSVSIGNNIKTIGKSAFEKDNKLKKIIFQGTKVKTFGKKAFKGIYSKAVFRMPSKKVKAYRRALLKKTGAKMTMKYRKK